MALFLCMFASASICGRVEKKCLARGVFGQKRFTRSIVRQSDTENRYSSISEHTRVGPCLPCHSSSGSVAMSHAVRTGVVRHNPLVTVVWDSGVCLLNTRIFRPNIVLRKWDRDITSMLLGSAPPSHAQHAVSAHTVTWEGVTRLITVILPATVCAYVA